MMRLVFIPALSIILTILNYDASAQELQATVTVNYEQLSQEARVNVQSMKWDVENYINNQRYTEKAWEGPRIPVDIVIYITGGSGFSYSGQLIIVSKRSLEGGEERYSNSFRFIDNKWEFQYSRNANLSYNKLRFQEFSSLLDFYMLLIIGLDLDSYEELSGTAYFDIAKQICQLGANNKAEGYSLYSQPGEVSKYNLVSDMIDIRYESFRKLIFAYYVDCLDLMMTDKTKAYQNLVWVIDEMVKFKKDKMVGPSVFVQYFFDSKGIELSELFKDYADKSIYDKLIYLDPGNSSVYQDAKDK